MVKSQCRRCRFDPWVREIPWRRKWQPTPVFLPSESHRQRSLANYSPWRHKDSDTAEKLGTQILSLPPFYRKRHWDSERLSNLLKVTQLASSKVGV